MLQKRHRVRWLLGLAAAAGLSVSSAQTFEIPAEMLSGMMGGMMGGGGGTRRKATEWPKSVSSDIDSEFDWLVNTEWKGKTASYLLLRGGIVESSLKECDREDQCLWAANGGWLMINTPTLKVVRFKPLGLDKVDRQKLVDKDQSALKTIQFEAEKAAKSGKKSLLEFSKLAEADETENIISRDLYEVLDVAEDADASTIKSKFRRLSISAHPDKGGDPKVFAEIRDAYETLSDPDSRRYYNLGGMQLARNIELGYKEADAQKAQLDGQLDGIPKNHPQYQMAKQQIEAQKKQFEKSTLKHELEKRMRSEDTEVFVPISAEELYNGVPAKTHEFKRLVICRGCRADPDSPKCKDCGRCPPEKVQVPKYGNTPFGRQVVGMKEKEQESRERCREVPMPITGLKVKKGAKPGDVLKYVSDMGHQTPGKLPGRVVLKVQHGSPEDMYTIAETDLHTVLTISLEEALFGFTYSWNHLGDQKVTVSRQRPTQPNEVVFFKKKGIVGDGNRGNLYVRLAVEMPDVAKDAKSLTIKAPAGGGKPRLAREESVELREGSTWRRWVEKESAGAATDKESKATGKSEL